jgi:hypothetical protein
MSIYLPNLTLNPKITIGDTIYPAENGQACRVTPCKVTKIEGNNIWVTGILWGKENKGEQTLQFTNIDYKGRTCLGYWDDGTNLGYSYWLLIEEQIPDYLKDPSYYDD